MTIQNLMNADMSNFLYENKDNIEDFKFVDNKVTMKINSKSAQIEIEEICNDYNWSIDKLGNEFIIW